jgi:tetratricopeptide (TPR) repeat protein
MDLAMWIVIVSAAVVLPLAGYWIYARTSSPSPRMADTDRFRMPMDADGTPPTETEELRRIHAATRAVAEAEAAPDHGPLQGKAGHKLLLANRFDTAVPYLERAVENAPTPNHLADLGYALLATGRLDEASLCIKQARAQEPNHADAWYYWSLVLAEMECHGESNRELEALLEAHPEHAPAMAELAMRWEKRGNDQQALLQLESVIDTTPDFIPARVNIVRLLCRRGQFVDAKPQLHWLSAHGVPVEVITRGDELHVEINGDPIFDGGLGGA